MSVLESETRVAALDAIIRWYGTVTNSDFRDNKRRLYYCLSEKDLRQLAGDIAVLMSHKSVALIDAQGEFTAENVTRWALAVGLEEIEYSYANIVTRIEQEAKEEIS